MIPASEFVSSFDTRASAKKLVNKIAYTYDPPPSSPPPRWLARVDTLNQTPVVNESMAKRSRLYRVLVRDCTRTVFGVRGGGREE